MPSVHSRRRLDAQARRPASERGSTLVELVFATALALVVIGAVITALAHQGTHRRRNLDSALVINAIADVFARLRTVPFATLPSPTASATLVACSRFQATWMACPATSASPSPRRRVRSSSTASRFPSSGSRPRCGGASSWWARSENANDARITDSRHRLARNFPPARRHRARGRGRDHLPAAGAGRHRHSDLGPDPHHRHADDLVPDPGAAAAHLPRPRHLRPDRQTAKMSTLRMAAVQDDVTAGAASYVGEWIDPSELVWRPGVEFLSASGLLSMNARLSSATRRVVFTLDPGEVANGSDDDGDGLIDQGTITLLHETVEVAVVRDVELCEFELDGRLLRMRIAIARRAGDGRIDRARMERAVYLRNN
jgi:hypothetical protein